MQTIHRIPHRHWVQRTAAMSFVLAVLVMPLHAAYAAKNVDDTFTDKNILKDWQLHCGSHYGIDVSTKQTVSGIKVSPLIMTKGQYLIFGRRIKLKEGVTYKLSFAARAERGQYSVRVGERASIQDYTLHWNHSFKPSESFETHEFEFVAKAPPVAGAVAKKTGRKKPKKIKDHQPHLHFFLGAAEGSFEIKWLKLMAVEGT